MQHLLYRCSLTIKNGDSLSRNSQGILMLAALFRKRESFWVINHVKAFLLQSWIKKEDLKIGIIWGI